MWAAVPVIGNGMNEPTQCVERPTDTIAKSRGDAGARTESGGATDAQGDAHEELVDSGRGKDRDEVNSWTRTWVSNPKLRLCSVNTVKRNADGSDVMPLSTRRTASANFIDIPFPLICALTSNFFTLQHCTL